MKKDQKKVFKVVGGAFLSIGIFSLIVAVLLAVLQSRAGSGAGSETEKVIATITRIETYENSKGETRHKVYVSYTYDGEEYEDVPLNHYSSTMYEGKEIEFRHTPDQGGQIFAGGWLYLVAALFAVAGVGFSLIGAIPLIVVGVVRSKHKELQETGRLIYAEADRVGRNMIYTVNHRRSFILYCHYTDPSTNQTYQFRSGDIWVDPSPYFPPGSQVPVLIKGEDFSRYHVDVERALAAQGVDASVSPGRL